MFAGVEDAALPLTFFSFLSYIGCGTYNNGLRQFILNMFDKFFHHFLLTGGKGGVPKSHHCGQ